MSYIITVSADKRYLVGKADAPVTQKVAQQMGEEYARLIEQTGIKRVLSDVRGSPNVMNTLENYGYAYTDAQYFKFPRDARVALLADPGDTSHDFAETVARNAGYQVRVFHSFESAIDWLFDKDNG